MQTFGKGKTFFAGGAIHAAFINGEFGDTQWRDHRRIPYLDVQVEIGSLKVNQLTSTYDIILPESFEAKLKSSIRIGKRLKSNEMDGSLDGLGHDVSIALFHEDGNRSEIFYGCDDYENGTLGIVSDYSKFWKVTMDSGFPGEFRTYIVKAKSRIAQKHGAKRNPPD